MNKPTYYHDQPRRPLPDEENDMTYYDERRESFEEQINVSDLTAQPPWWGGRAITDINLSGTIVEEYEYDVVDGHRDPASVYGTYSYEDVRIELWSDDNLVLAFELDDLSESDTTWGRLVTEDEAASAAPASQPFYQWLVDNREIAGYFPEEIR
jgi:hypothetical protein